MEQEQSVRLNKYLSDAGICSRREADRLIEAGKVIVNGQAAQLGSRVFGADKIEVNNRLVEKQDDKVILAFYKPRGIVCTFEKREENNIIDFIHYPVRITYAGRLDKDSEGLMLMTNQGELVNQIMRAKNEHEKEYVVTVTKPVSEEFLSKLREGIWLEELGVITRKCRAWKTADRTFKIILTQGLNRQIRRMCRACGYHVSKLVRVRIMNIKLDNLKKGQYRLLTEEEIRGLYQLLEK